MENNGTLPSEDSKTAIGLRDGQFDYPSTRGQGYDLIDYQRRAPMIAGKPGELRTVSLKIKDLPDIVIGDLNRAHQEGNLAEEVNRHLNLLEAGRHVDKGTLGRLRDYQSQLVGHPGPDGETLECITETLKTLRCTERGL
jgi:hypothetical protein